MVDNNERCMTKVIDVQNAMLTCLLTANRLTKKGYMFVYSLAYY